MLLNLEDWVIKEGLIEDIIINTEDAQILLNTILTNIIHSKTWINRFKDSSEKQELVEHYLDTLDDFKIDINNAISSINRLLNKIHELEVLNDK